MARNTCRDVVAWTFNALEPDQTASLPARVRRGTSEFRRNRRTPRSIASLFGPIRLERCFYQATDGESPGLAPLEHRLGIVAGAATAALADEAARLNADLPQEQTREALGRHYSVHWADGTLRKVVAAMAGNYAPQRHEAQVERLREWLQEAQKSRGKHAPTLSVGRDGVIIPMRPCWEEASTATLTVLDRRGRRLGTVYLGRMPELGQATMTEQLQRLIEAVLLQWQGPLPRLVYVTDAGAHPQDFFYAALKWMKHPRSGERLQWEWLVDYYHACERITKLAEGLFGAGPEASQWAQRMRHVLRDQSQGVTRVVQRALALARHRGLQRTRKEFNAAINYLKNYQAHMNYAQARRRGLPIGSGVTEAACKTIFGCRFKQSGMRWKKEQGQHVLDLRVILKSGVWDRCRDRWLQGYRPLENVTPRLTRQDHRTSTENYALPT